jgi:hypothetical protein
MSCSCSVKKQCKCSHKTQCCEDCSCGKKITKEQVVIDCEKEENENIVRGLD